MRVLKDKIKKALLRHGYHLRRVEPNQLGCEPFEDMRRLTAVENDAMLFDVGANCGQTIELFREHFQSPVIHAFEPNPSTFEELKRNVAACQAVHLHCVALGDQVESRTLFDNSESTLSSFLPPGKDYGWGGKVVGQSVVPVDTVDRFCQSLSIPCIDVLKIDTQGFELEVLNGAQAMIREHKVHLIYLELQFGDAYAGVPQFDDVYLHLKNVGFLPVAFYGQVPRGSRLAWMDGLFLDPLWTRSSMADSYGARRQASA